jgi:hypothetical protein
MIIKEFISFERGQDPKKSLDIGENSTYVKTEIFNALLKAGIYFHDWDKTGKNKERIIKNIYIFKKLIDKLITAGLDINSIDLSHPDALDIKTIQVLNVNHVIHHCLTEEDAYIVIDICKKYSISGRDNFSISTGTKCIYISDENEWLDNIIENRKKYKNL